MENYRIFVEVFKGYLDTALQANIWFYAVTGAIVTHYLFNQSKEKSYLKFSLVLPFVLGVLIIVLSFLGIGQAHFIESKMLELLRLELARNKELVNIPVLENIPAAEILVNFLKVTIVSISLVCIGLTLLFWLVGDCPKKCLEEKIEKCKWLKVGLIILGICLLIACYCLFNA